MITFEAGICDDTLPLEEGISDDNLHQEVRICDNNFLQETRICDDNFLQEVEICNDNSPLWTIGAEYLFLRPTIDRTTFALSNTVNPALFPNGTSRSTTFGGDSIKNEFCYHSGYSVFGSFFFNCDNDITVKWCQLIASDSKDFTGNFFPNRSDPYILTQYLLLPGGIDNLTLGLFEGSAQAHSSFKFRSLDATLGQKIFENQCVYLQLRGGVYLAEIKIDERFTYRDTVLIPPPSPPSVLSVRDKSRFMGVGPQLGLNIDVDLCQGLYLQGGANASFLVSRLRKELLSTLLIPPTTLSNIGFRDNRHYKIVPEADLNFGLGYERCLLGYLVNLEIGFRAMIFFKCPAKFSFR